MLESVTMASERLSEGQQIKALLDERGANVQDLARAGGVSWQAAKKWVQSTTLGAGARETCVAALGKLGIDPRAIWPSIGAPSASVTRLEELKAHLRGFSPEQLETIKKLLEAEKSDQIRLVDFIEGIAFAQSV